MHIATTARRVLLLLLTSVWPTLAQQQPSPGPQQIADPNFTPSIDTPTYVGAARPLVVLDEAHENFHTLSGRYKPFADLLIADGYRVVAGTQPFTANSLAGARVLVIANALASGITSANINNPPSAFTPAESDAVRDWVARGGSLLLIADHSPFGATVAALSARFGVDMGKGYAWQTGAGTPPTTTISHTRDTGALAVHPITQGVNRVVAFTGQSLSVPPGAVALLRFGPSSYESAGNEVQADLAAFQGGKPHHARSVAGRAQGVALEYGKGRLVVMGEAAMFSAQVIRFTDSDGRNNETKMGMNVAGNDNSQFLLNIMKWLTRCCQ
jgi:hypothetical protein